MTCTALYVVDEAVKERLRLGLALRGSALVPQDLVADLNVGLSAGVERVVANRRRFGELLSRRERGRARGRADAVQRGDGGAHQGVLGAGGQGAQVHEYTVS